MRAWMRKLGPSATDIIRADHTRVVAAFHRYKADSSPARKKLIVNLISTALQARARMEEEIFYPAARNALDEEDLIDEAIVEHASAKDLIAQLEEMAPDDDLFDAKIKVLSELIEHHVEEEEDEMFPKLRKAKLDTGALGPQLAERKQQLADELGVGDEVTIDPS